MKNSGKIAGLILLAVFVIAIVLMAVKVEDKKTFSIEAVEVTGGKLYADSSYVKYAKLNDKNEYKYLSLSIAKDRLESHPYVERVEAKYEGLNKAVFRITEKKFNAIVLENEQQMLVTEKFQLIPIMAETTVLNLPFISNTSVPVEFKNFSYVKNNRDLSTAFKILGTFKLTDEEILSNLSQIDLRNGKDILVYFSNLEYPVVLGRGEEVKKSVYLSSLWKFIKGTELNKYMDYIDLRFEKHVYLGISEGSQANEGAKI